MDIRPQIVERAMALLLQHAVEWCGGAVRVDPGTPIHDVLVNSGFSLDGARELVQYLENAGVLLRHEESGAPFYEILRDGARELQERIAEELLLGQDAPRVALTRSRRIAVFIDLENVAKHLGAHHDVISIERIESVLRELGEVHIVYAFLDVTRGPHEVVGDLDRSGVVTVHCKKRSRHGGLEDTVDEKLKQLVRKELEHADIDAVAVASNDNGFAELLREVRRRQREAILLIAEPGASGELQRVADRVIEIGSAFMREVAACLRDLRESDPFDRDAVAACAASHGHALDALVEIIVSAASIGRPFAPQFLRDRIIGNARADLPHVATIEEMLRCTFLLRDLGCFRHAGEQATKLVLDRAHPLVSYALERATDGALDAPRSVRSSEDDASARVS